VDVAERFADGLATEEERDAVQGKAHWAAANAEYVNFGNAAAEPYVWATCAASYATYPSAFEAARNAASAIPNARGADRETERHWVLGLVRCVFGNPFRPLAVVPAWRTPAAVALARAAYDERHLPSGHLDAARLLVLADALEEAGATDAQLLGHLRSAGPHVRGCAAVDAVLGLG
jgi:hypothetical protein